VPVLPPGLGPSPPSRGAQPRTAASPPPARSAAPAGTPAAVDGELDRAAADDPALIVYTSGTTGAPKGAVLSHGNLLAGARALALAWRWTPADRLVLALPLFHVHGLCAGLFGTLTAGASAVVLPRFSPEGVLAAAGDHAATLFFGVPTMYHRLLGRGTAADLARLRLCVSGSAPLPAPVWQAMRAEGGVEVLERYGMTETLLTVSNPYRGERRPGTVGFPLPGVQARLAPLDGDGGAPVEGIEEPPEGQLLVAGPSVFGGYWERPAATEAAFEGRWFRTGDVAGWDAEGYLAILGRRNDLILSGGFNVYPAEVEDVLLGHPDVAEVAVAGQPSEEWGETVVAWVVPAGARPPVETLEALAAGQLAGYKRPRAYRFVDSLPRNAMGKVQRDRLTS
jgi:malonyl-CoA/methylmalonyl-CoA synthetase